MQGTHAFPQKASTEERTYKQVEVDREAGEPSPELRPSVEQSSQAKVDTNHPDATPGGLTMIEEERVEARELEIERTRTRWDRRPDSAREARCRRAAARGSVERRQAFARRAASVDPWADPDRGDPQSALSREELGAVNRAADRLAAELEGFTRAAVSRHLAERAANGSDVTEAVIRTAEALRKAPGQVIPIAAVGKVDRQEVDIEGRVTTLWEPSHPAIAQVGLIEDETGRVKFTAWKKSQVAMVAEGERVRFRGVAKNWYDGRVSVALTGRSRVVFPDVEPSG